MSIYINIVMQSTDESIRLKNMISKYYPEQNFIINVYDSQSENLDDIKKNPIDLLIADVNLNGKSVFTILNDDVARTFKTIICTVALDRAFEAFKYNVIHFIRKPVLAEDLQKGIERFLTYRHTNDSLLLNDTNKQKVISYKDIQYFSSNQNYVKIYLGDGQYEIMRDTIENIENKTGMSFLRVHRSFLINKKFLAEFDSKQCVLKSGTVIPVSKNKYQYLKNSV